MKNPDLALDIKGLIKLFGTLVAVDHISFQVNKGEFFGFVGPNGAGKTIFLTTHKFPLIFISGVFVPLSELPGFARSICFISPLTYFTDLARYTTGGENYFPIAVDLLAIIGFTVAAWIIAVKLHNRTLPKRI